MQFLTVFLAFLLCTQDGAAESLLLGQLKGVKNTNPWLSITLIKIAEASHQPTYLTHSGDGSGRLFIVEKEGRILILKDGMVFKKPFLDISKRVRSLEVERGLLSLAFHPDFKKNRHLFVYYTDLKGDVVISRFRVSKDEDIADPESEEILLHIPQPASNHNGGQLQFGPDGYLYIGTGDGGGAGDPWGNAQNRAVLLGKLLRIDVDKGRPYRIPKDNPFVGIKGVRPEIWAYGLRNPWRFSFDSPTGDLYIADVGQDDWEEVDIQPQSSSGGKNYGWDITEGFACFKPHKGCKQDGITFPLLAYSHDLGCSVTGGYVYRGRGIPELTGTYLFGDFCSGKIWGLRKDTSGAWEVAEFLDTDHNISSFGVDEDGEVYLLDYSRGTLYRISRRPE